MNIEAHTSNNGEQRSFSAIIQKLFTVARRLWFLILRFFGVLFLIRFSLLMTALGLGAVFFAQGQEVLIAMADAPPTLPEVLRKIAFLIATMLCAFSAWYTSRVMLLFFFDEVPASDATCYPKLKEHLPRWLGALIILLVAVALLVASLKNAWLALFLFVIAILFIFFVYFRRRWFRLDLLTDQKKNLKSVAKLPNLTKRILLWMIGFYAVSMVVFTYLYGYLGPALGTATLVLLTMALMIPTGTALVYYGNRYRVPVIGLLLVLAAVFSLFNDNHRVRQTSGMRTYEAVAKANKRLQGAQTLGGRSLQSYKNLDAYFSAWLKELAPMHRDKKIPVILVAAEGGGIRAAYWTALVLAELQDQAAAKGIDFGRHVFAISGVSGGSLGSAVFAALLKTPHKARPNDDGTPCIGAPDDAYRCRAQRILSRDFLSPTIAVLLFPDLLQRFLPVAIFDDRAVALERSWEKAWQYYEQNNQFENAFEDLWRQDAHEVPLLFLNSTVVETGQRIIVNPIAFDQEDFRRTFHNAYNAAAVVGTQVPLSTAVHMSARFTYVSPAGTIERKDPKDSPDERAWFRVVDGGYFENSGAVTLDEILMVLTRKATEENANIQPIVIHISNEPIKKKKTVAEESAGKHVIMGEILSPVRALINVRPARGFQARDVLASRVGAFGSKKPGEHIHFRLCANEVKLPLGWMLSKLSQDDMTHQLIGYPEASANANQKFNAHNVKRVLALIDGRNDVKPVETVCW